MELSYFLGGSSATPQDFHGAGRGARPKEQLHAVLTTPAGEGSRAPHPASSPTCTHTLVPVLLSDTLSSSKYTPPWLPLWLADTFVQNKETKDPSQAEVQSKILLSFQYIPMPVLYGVFLYMGVASLNGIQVRLSPPHNDRTWSQHSLVSPRPQMLTLLVQ